MAAINRGLEESGVFVVLLTPEAVRSKWVRRETDMAVSLEHDDKLRVYPLSFKECRLPPLWRGYQFIDYSGEYRSSLNRFLRALDSGELLVETLQAPASEDPTKSKQQAELKPRPIPVPVQGKKKEKSSFLIPDPPEIRIHPITRKEMIRIPAGEFLYGEKKEKLNLPEFWMDKTPVTNAEYALFVADKGVEPPNNWQGKEKPPKKISDHPVVYVSWHDAQDYAAWANCRMPTEQEWEKAARGLDGRIYPWGPAWEENHCNTDEACIGTTSPVGQFSPRGDSPYGNVDMSGNVWEWTNSWIDSDKIRRVMRGGSWVGSHRSARVSYRGWNDPFNWSCNVGFRAVSLVGSGF